MAQLQFTADVNKTVTVVGNTYTITMPELPDGVHVYLNEVELKANTPVELTDNMTLTVSVDTVAPSEVTVTYNGANSVTYDGQEINNNEGLEVTPGKHTLNFIGATSIPPVQISGEGVTSFSVNGTAFTATDLPYTFTPKGGQTNQLYITGSDTESRSVTLTGTNISTVTINGNQVKLPYTFEASGATQIAVAGEIYQLDLTSMGGAVFKQDGVIISDGTSQLHKIIDIDHDTFINADATHVINFTGEDIKSVSINGVTYPIESLPVEVQNRNMTATVVVHGYEPSTVHVVGNYMETVTVDGTSVPINQEGSVDFELTTVENSHFINIIGSQPREYGITWNDHNSTTLEIDGTPVASGTTTMISKDVYVESTPIPVPVHFESDDTVRVEVNGRLYTSKDFTFNVSQDTEVDITTETCKLTVDYGDNSYSIIVPQSIVTLTAPHRDGWLFDGWSSDNTGIEGSKSVRCTVDLTGKSYANLVCHYQRYVTIDKPNNWN